MKDTTISQSAKVGKAVRRINHNLKDAYNRTGSTRDKQRLLYITEVVYSLDGKSDHPVFQYLASIGSNGLLQLARKMNMHTELSREATFAYLGALQRTLLKE